MTRCTLRLTLSALAMTVMLALPTKADANRTARTASGDTLTDDEPAPVDSCDEYYACIDSCAEDYAHMVDFCIDYFGDHQDECISLADGVYEECLMECGPRPEGC
jgi:hypothetical protein